MPHVIDRLLLGGVPAHLARLADALAVILVRQSLGAQVVEVRILGPCPIARVQAVLMPSWV